MDPTEPLIEALTHDRSHRILTAADFLWHDRAACKGKPVDWWVPTMDQDGRGRSAPDPRATELCTTCPAKTPCLRWAIDNDELGYWGGTSRKQRLKIRRTPRSAA